MPARNDYDALKKRLRHHWTQSPLKRFPIKGRTWIPVAFGCIAILALSSLMSC